MSIPDTVVEAADEFIAQLRRRQIEGSLPCAKRTAEILRLLITKSRHSAPEGFLEDVRVIGTRLQAAKPLELAVGNTVRRVMHLIREESHVEDEEDLATVRSGSAGSPSTPRRGVHFAPEAAAAPRASAAEAHGLLSRALRPTMLAARQRSLHNLLDLGVAGSADVAVAAVDGERVTPVSERPARGDRAAEGAGPSHISSHDSLVSAGASSRQHSQAASEAGDSDAGDARSRRGQRAKAEVWKGRATIIEEMNELLDELDEIDGNIAQQAAEHIHANEVILTFAASNTVSLFLKEATKKRNFQLVVAEGAPTYGGQALAMQMAQLGVPTTLIPDAAIFAMMARVNKVLVGAHALLANGGIIAPAGTALVAQAARKHAVPFVVLVGLHKLSPMFPHDPSVTFNDFKSPGDVLSYDALAETLAAARPDDDSTAEFTYLHVPNPMYDYVAPELVSLFVTDTGGYQGSYVYRLLAEYYTRDDYVLSEELLDQLGYSS